MANRSKKNGSDFGCNPNQIVYCNLRILGYSKRKSYLEAYRENRKEGDRPHNEEWKIRKGISQVEGSANVQKYMSHLRAHAAAKVQSHFVDNLEILQGIRDRAIDDYDEKKDKGLLEVARKTQVNIMEALGQKVQHHHVKHEDATPEAMRKKLASLVQQNPWIIQQIEQQQLVNEKIIEAEVVEPS